MTDKGRILVVEDEPLSADVIVRRLRKAGFEVTHAGSPDTAMSLMQLATFDVMLTDIALGGASGLDFIRELRSQWSHQTLPIICVSAMVDSDDVIEALNAGANDYVVKPINFPVLLARINSALSATRAFSLLVEAERQRVMIETLAASASRLSRPILSVVDTLESAINAEANDQPELREQLQELYTWVEQAVDVIEEVRKVAAMRGVPYTERQIILQDRPETARQD